MTAPRTAAGRAHARWCETNTGYAPEHYNPAILAIEEQAINLGLSSYAQQVAAESERAAAAQPQPSGLREALAALEHEQWVTWAGSLMATEQLRPERLSRWRPLMVDYDLLSEGQKDQDRAWADRVLTLAAAAGVAQDGAEGEGT